MENLDFMLFSQPSQEEEKNIEKLNEFLTKLNATAEFHKVNEFYFLRINYDTDDIQRICSRNAGRHRVMPNDYISPAEIRERMKTEKAEDIALELGISRSTLFRKLKQAEECGYLYLF